MNNKDEKTEIKNLNTYLTRAEKYEIIPSAKLHKAQMHVEYKGAQGTRTQKAREFGKK